MNVMDKKVFFFIYISDIIYMKYIIIYVYIKKKRGKERVSKMNKWGQVG